VAKGDRRKSLGRLGEDLACEYLERNGFMIVERNYRTQSGEIDVIARRKNCEVFVEVKARRTGDYGEPEEAVTGTKVRRIRGVASEYLGEKGLGKDVRFDVVSVLLDGKGNLEDLRHIPDAF
jgi:putative endonuclease